MKKILRFLLVFAAMFCMTCFTAFAEDTDDPDTYIWSLMQQEDSYQGRLPL